MSRKVEKRKTRGSLVDWNQQKLAADQTKEFLCANGSHSVFAWLHYFDADHNEKIDFSEFCQGMQALQYQGDIVALWKAMDTDGSGELTFDEIDAESADLWGSFRRWCAKTFASSKDMVVKLNRLAGKSAKTVQEADFIEQLPKFGWTNQTERILFNALDNQRQGSLGLQQLVWLDAEVRKQKRKEAARKRAECATEKNLRQKIHCVRVLDDFKTFLTQEFGHVFKAWRRYLDLDGGMSVQKAELFKACVAMGFQGDVRALWRALDADNSGSTALEELDPDCASILATFKKYGDKNFGNAQAFFRAIDRHKAKRLKMNDFIDGCKHIGFQQNLRSLFQWLDWQNKKYLTSDDLACLDSWRPSAWLTAEPNPEAAEDFKAAVHKKCKHMVKAWRAILDRDNSNRVSWHEFEDAAKRLHWRWDVPGAWLAFDEDCSGYITLREFDEAAHDALVGFKKWADSEFGSVTSAFWVLDADQSMELTYREFRRATRDFGYSGDPQVLFGSLDCDDTGRLSMDEVAFLDTWDVDDSKDVRRWAAMGGESLPPVETTKKEKPELGKNLLNYKNDVPGPGTYNLPGGLGHRPTEPTVRYGGAFSFSRSAISAPWMQFKSRNQTPRFGIVNSPRSGEKPGPGAYSPRVKAVTKRKPGCFFGSARREPQYLTMGEPTPGPAEYDAKCHFQGPQFSIKPRRRMELHPSQERSGVKVDRSEGLPESSERSR